MYLKLRAHTHLSEYTRTVMLDCTHMHMSVNPPNTSDLLPILRPGLRAQHSV